MDMRKPHLPLPSFVIDTSLALRHERSAKTIARATISGISDRSAVDPACSPSPLEAPASQRVFPSVSQFLSYGATENRTLCFASGCKTMAKLPLLQNRV